MKTTMLIATMTVELVATMKPKDGIITAQIVHALRVVVPHNGPMICGVMMKTTMLIATLTVELVASMKPKDGIITAKIVSALSVHHLDGMGITTVMTVSILEIVNTMEEIAAVITCLLPTARIANALIQKPNFY